MFLDLEIIKNELMVLPQNKSFCLQGVEEIDNDPFFGVGHIKHYNPYKETDFVYPNFDIPHINSLIKKLNMYRTRVMILEPKSCYSIHTDPTKRIHIPVYTNEKCWIIVNKEIIYLPADGNYYEIDTTHQHTALNGSSENRIHIVGLVT